MNNAKKLLLITIFSLLLLPLTTFAENDKYISMNLKETLAAEGIELTYDDYEENDKQITIYLFRGHNCTYCQSFLEYLNSITEKYGKYFKLRSYEIWSSQNNANLYSDVAEFFGMQARSVPFIVIGDQVFDGYGEDYNSSIEKAIKDLYNSKDRYDVLKEMEKAEKLKYRKQFLEFGLFSIICSAIITLGVAVGIIVYENNKNKKLEMKLKDLERKVDSRKSPPDSIEENKTKYHKEHKKHKDGEKEHSLKR